MAEFKGRYFNIFIVFLVLFGLPLITFFFLRKGGNITIDAYEKLDKNFPVNHLLTTSEWSDFLNSDTTYNTLICYLCNDSIDQSMLDKVQETFINEYPLNYVLITKEENNENFGDQKKYRFTFSTTEVIDSLDGSVLVVNSKDKVRRIMRPKTKEDFADLTRSIALLMPGKLKESIQIKKEIDK